MGTNVPKKKIKEWPKCRKCGEEYVRESNTYWTGAEIETPEMDLLCEKCLEVEMEKRDAERELKEKEQEAKREKAKEKIEEAQKAYDCAGST